MSGFEYLTGLLTIVLGLAVARTLGGIGFFLDIEKRGLRDWTRLGFCLALVAMQIDWWRVLWITLGESSLQAEAVYLWISATVMLYLAGYLLVPQPNAEMGQDKTQRLRVRPAFFACMAIHFCAFPFYKIVQGQGAALELGPPVMIGLCILGPILRHEKAQFTFALLWFGLAYVTIALSFGTPFV